jgi:hypothetical protein
MAPYAPHERIQTSRPLRARSAAPAADTGRHGDVVQAPASASPHATPALSSEIDRDEQNFLANWVVGLSRTEGTEGRVTAEGRCGST